VTSKSPIEKVGEMATKKKKKAIEFQIGWPGLIAIIASTFCVLAWTFVLGFWMGQKLMGGHLTSSPHITTLNGEQTGDQGLSAPEEGLKKTEIPGIPGQSSQAQDAAALKELRAELQHTSRQTGGLADLPTEVVAPKAAPEGRAAKEEKETRQTDGGRSGGQEEQASGQQTSDKAAGGQGAAAQAPVKQAAKPASKPAPKQESAKGVRQQPAPKGPSKSAKVTQERVQKPAKKNVVLQIASYKDPARAEKEARRWQAKGFKTRVKRVNLGAKGIWYRLYIGAYSTVDEAKKAAARLAAREGLTSVYVVPNP